MARHEPIRIGLVGIGRAGWSMHSPLYDENCERFRPVAACDPHAPRRKMFAERFNCRTYRTLEELLADDEVELVDIACRSIEHTPFAIAALKTGRDVVVEKPMALDYAEARRLQRAAEKAGGRLFVYHNRRFEPGFLHVREIIDSGKLGEVHTIKLRRHNFQLRDDWQTLVRAGGGMLLNWGPHIIDHALRLLGAPVASMWSDLQLTAAVGDAEDHVKILLRGENGRVVDLEISGGVALGEPIYHVAGTRGALTCDDENIRLRYLDPKRKLPRLKAKTSLPALDGGFGGSAQVKWVEETLPVGPKARSGLGLIWTHIYETIREDAPFPITLDEAVGVMKIISDARKGTPFART